MHKKHHCILTKKDRERIELWSNKGISYTTIAQRLGYHRSTISREIARGTDSHGLYRALYAHKKGVARIRSRKRGIRKLFQNHALQAYVHHTLQRGWSPFQIATKLHELYTDETMHISHEAIYQYIYVLPRGSLKKTLIEGLRQSRKYRRTQKQTAYDEETRGKIAHMISIHERPPAVEDRSIPGHWEGDLIMGKYKRTAIATLVERTTRYTMLVALPHGKDAVSVRKALAQRLTELPKTLTKSLTYDQGKEMSEHKRFTIDTGIHVYFADPASPWQRGTNENTNGLIRQYFPKGTDFSEVSDEKLREVEERLNGRPRAAIGFKFPKEVFYRLVALNV